MARPAVVPIAPRLAAELTETDDIALDNDQRWEALRVRADFAGQIAEDLEVSGCRVTGSSFARAELVRARVTDAVFERCDLAAVVLEHAVLTRVQFDDCRLSGADLSGSRLVDVGFREYGLRGAGALRGTTISSGQVLPVALQVLALLEITVDDEREPPPR